MARTVKVIINEMTDNVLQMMLVISSPFDGPWISIFEMLCNCFHTDKN